MKTHNLLAFILLGVSLVRCGSENISFSIDTSALKQQYLPQEILPLTVVNPEEKVIDSVVYYLNNTKVGTAEGNKKLDAALQSQKLGYQNIKALVYSEGKNSEVTARIELISAVKTKILSYEIINTYPHDIKAYTQGLEFYRDTLIEGTGQYEKSRLRKTNYKTGEIYKEVVLDNKYFGEGITVFNNKIYELTWKENTGFVYNADNLAKEKDFAYFRNVQGWGLTHDDNYLYQSDGSEKIYMLDPATLKEVDYINVYAGDRKVKELNELEWIDGKIYSNVYQTDAISIIDPKTGSVEAMIDMSALKAKVTQHPDLNVLNGIAYNPKTKTIFVTGKNWDKMFEIRVK